MKIQLRLFIYLSAPDYDLCNSVFNSFFNETLINSSIKIEELQNDERCYLNAEECLKYNMCDGIIENELVEKTEFNNAYNKFNNDIGFDFETVGAIKIFSGGRCYNTTEYNEIVAEFKKELAERGFNNIILS